MTIALLRGYEAVLVFTGALGLVAFSYLAALLHRLSRLGLTGTEPALGFALLGASHAWVIVMALSGPRLAYTAYTATSSFAAAGFLLLALPDRHREYALTLLALPVTMDAVAAATALAAVRRFSGAAKVLVAILAACYVLRALGALLLTSTTWAAILALAELARSIAATLLATYYAITTHKG